MPLADSTEIRAILSHLLPGLVFDSNALASGQRLVYFCHFEQCPETPSVQARWVTWGNVVVKVSEDVHPSVIARLEKERQILNELNSRYYPRLLYHDVFRDDPVTDSKFKHRLFVTIEERICGVPLDGCRERFTTEASVLVLLKHLVEGLTLLWAHQQKIIHRDLKPANIIIRDDNCPVVIDLGIVREEGSAGLTGTHWQMGPCTPAYASSEQLKNQKRLITFKADFFSLGVIVYELLTGKNPFVESQHEPIEFVVNRALTEHPRSLFELGLASRSFSDLVERMMAKEPYMRPRTVEILARELQALGEVQ
jgi:serine/threonine protein kinase